MIICPSSALPCYAKVCNEGGWPCDPTMRTAPPAQAAPALFQTDEIDETEDGIALSGPAEPGARFEIEP